MADQQIPEAIWGILRSIRPDADFENSSNFAEEGLLDSFDIVSVVSALDEHFGINIDGRQILPDNFASIETMTSLVERALAAEKDKQ
jgi:acyl carrier protein